MTWTAVASNTNGWVPDASSIEDEYAIVFLSAENGDILLCEDGTILILDGISGVGTSDVWSEVAHVTSIWTT